MDLVVLLLFVLFLVVCRLVGSLLAFLCNFSRVGCSLLVVSIFLVVTFVVSVVLFHWCIELFSPDFLVSVCCLIGVGCLGLELLLLY